MVTLTEYKFLDELVPLYRSSCKCGR